MKTILTYTAIIIILSALSGCGDDGSNGTNGTNGKDGKDAPVPACTPVKTCVFGKYTTVCIPGFTKGEACKPCR
jgi:hypothetical protein